jgi:hypothetical protein
VGKTSSEFSVDFFTVHFNCVVLLQCRKASVDISIVGVILLERALSGHLRGDNQINGKLDWDLKRPVSRDLRTPIFCM